jgi:tetratricopeptide (TPR) repeat protein
MTSTLTERTFSFALVAGAILLDPPFNLHASDASPCAKEPVECVVLRHTHRSLKSRPDVSADAAGQLTNEIVFVEKLQEDWAYVHDQSYQRSEASGGWIQKSETIPLTKALEYFSQRIEKDSTDVEAYKIRAKVYRFQQEYKGAIADLDAVLSVHPESVEILTLRGNIWADLHDNKRAISDYTCAIRANPDYASAYHNRADAFYDLSEYDKALKDCTQAVRLEPRQVEHYSLRGSILYSLKEFDKAVEDDDKAVQLAPEREYCRYNRGLAWLAKGAPEKALVDFNECLRLNPKFELALTNRGELLCTMKDYRKGLADFDAFLKLRPDEPSVLQRKAVILAKGPDEDLRDSKRAIAAAQRACELTGFKKAIFVQTLATSYAADGKVELAIKWQRKALDLAKGDASFDVPAATKRLKLYEAGVTD